MNEKVRCTNNLKTLIFMMQEVLSIKLVRICIVFNDP